MLTKYKETAAYISRRIHGETPETAIILGSGLGLLADKIEQPIVIPYTEIPHFMHSTAMGHRGNLIFGTLGGKKVLAMQGRFHYYEGYGMQEVTYPVRVMYFLGVRNLFVSNAAGGVNFNYRIGDLMIIRDHINLLPNPLIGKNIDEIGLRFPDMTRPYDLPLIAAAEAIAAAAGIRLQKGVYLAGSGPSYETPAEYAFFRMIGADAVGMSTIPEVIVARHAGMRVFGMSVITNEACEFPPDYVNSGDDVIKAAAAATETMSFLFTKIIEQIAPSPVHCA
ncbi:MAG: purine-nucleoside phosphorylase [Prevotellaceae bacterium]|jgi:purine-nucleoside phosphorylase|nr:purine-nucleoside phosphorylase [Prevotellaceae bacterium]